MTSTHIEVSQIEIGVQCLTEFPGGSDALAEVIAAGIDVELGLAIVLATLGGSDPHVSAIVLGHLRSISEQEKAVLAAAKIKLSASAYENLVIATKAVAAHRKRRNAFAHHMWARFGPRISAPSSLSSG